MGEILWTPHRESKADMDLKEGSSKNRHEGQLCAYSALMEVEEEEW